MIAEFSSRRSRLARQFEHPAWVAGSGQTAEELEAAVLELEKEPLPRAILKARTLALIAREARLAVDREDIFQDKLDGAGIMRRQRLRWQKEVQAAFLPGESARMDRAWSELGAYCGNADFGHTSPNTRLLLGVGLPGLARRVELAAQRPGLTQAQRDFYASCAIALDAARTAARRLAAAVAPTNPDNAAALLHIADAPPATSYEAMQLLILYFFLHDYIAGTRVRTLGRLDVLLWPFYRNDLAQGVCTEAEFREMLKFFLHKFWCAKVPFDLPFCLGGTDADGNDAVTELSYLIVETYHELDIYSPKLHIRVSEHTPERFIKLILSYIRAGSSSFVFLNDRVAEAALTGVGVAPGDVWDYVPIGCYEPAVWGVEMGCTGNGGVSLPKAVELVFNNGRDLATGTLCGVETGQIGSYDAFLAAVKAQIAYMADQAMRYVTAIERYYGRIGPDPLLSCQYDRSVELGLDVFEGGAKYNNSSLSFYSIASLVDSLCAVRRLVFEEKRLSFDALGEILRQNWAGHERERLLALHLEDTYGNTTAAADAAAAELAGFCAGLVNNRPNGRGGVFKAALFSIDYCFRTGERTMATPDGRRAGEPLSKNLCAVAGMDRNGITALILSAAKLDLSRFPNGSVLDFVLHPSAVAGEDGLAAFYGLLMTYFKLGGFAMHGNIFDAEDLKRAQRDPDSYRTLQVRVCGWNAYFVNLSRAEQDAFIRQAGQND